MTEGGVRLSKMASYYPGEERLAAQALSWQQGWDRHHRDDGPGAGIGCSRSTRPTPTPASTPGCSTRGPRSFVALPMRCGRRCRRMRELASDEPSMPAVITADPQAGEPKR
jgi:hypothetical protein